VREGLKFHDGPDFDAEDVKVSIARIPVVTGPTTTAIPVPRVASVDIIDPNTIHINTDGQAATLPNDFIRLLIVLSDAAEDYSTPEMAASGFNSSAATASAGP
jgi:peptide/nickel transport system substrate-binding protein